MKRPNPVSAPPRRTAAQFDGRQPAAFPPTGLFLACLILLGLGCRLLLIHLKPLVGTDETIYLALGRNLWRGEGLSLLGYPITMCPPLLPLVAGFFSLLTENLEWGTNFVYVVSGAAVTVPYFFLARRLYGTRVARRATLLLTLYPDLLLSFYWGSMTEPLYTLVLVAGLFFLYRGLHEGRSLDFCLTGCLLALVYLCRSEGILFFPVLLLLILLARNSLPAASGHALAKNLLMMTLCFAVISAPYPFFLKKQSDSLSLSGKTKLILLAGAMPLAERERLMGRLEEDGASFIDYERIVKDKTVVGMILENPKVLLGGSVLQVKSFVLTLFSWKVFPAFLLPFLALGLLTGPWNQARTVQEGFLIAACVPFLVFLTFRIWPRYLLPMTPVLLLWTGRGWLVAEAWLRRRPDRPAGDRPEFSSPGQQGRTETRGWAAVAQSRIRNTLKGGEYLSLALPQEHFQQQQANRAISGLSRLRWVVRQWAWLVPSVLICFPLAVILVAKPLKAERLVQYPVEYKEAGKWMKAHLPADALILARKPEIAYYAGRLMHPLPNEDLIRVLGYARKKGIGYLVVDDYFIATRPQLRFLLASDEFPADLALLHEARAPNGRKVRVFAIRSDTPGGAADGGQDPSK